MKIGANLADVDPMQLDSSVRFDSVGGLSSHIAALKEMVVFPLLYPEVFEKFKIQPPRYLNMLSLVAVVCAVLL
ncbi:ATPase family AAA domain-containing protein 2 [Cricetulus griseus]|uniref:ATPase family AAA domain-containing protein 2 n=1 Tax=Cricetulus griseus TaxID=10029 RepID=G3IP58_CRIGR|nr:ATPase family AAA domain-containing protein 2 [Cricetulus griseus]